MLCNICKNSLMNKKTGNNKLEEFNWEEFQKAVSFLKSGINNLKWRDVIKASCNKDVLVFNKDSYEGINILDRWITENLNLLQELGLSYQGRVNEFGNFMESQLEKNFEHKELKFLPVLNSNGKVQSSGYPDYKISYKKCIMYGDCKVISTKTKLSSFRSFYYQPTKTGKVLEDAQHFLLVFIREGKNGNNPPFKIVDYKIVDLYDFTVGFKAEFQANNIETFNLKELSKKT